MGTAVHAMSGIHSELRLRVSTALLMVALMALPFATLWVGLPGYFPERTFLHGLFGWLYFEMPLQLMALSFVLAFFTGLDLSFRRLWAGAVQCVGEMGAAFSCLLFLSTAT
ncbi:MAG: hypothetical protein P4L83_09100 [Nevskia sp.]|nr:hypothetical protein [Nevskia sp.]